MKRGGIFITRLALLIAGSLLAAADAAVSARSAGTYIVSDGMTGVVSRGRYAYTASGLAGIQVFDLEKGGRAKPVGGWNRAGGISQITLAGKHLVALGSSLWVLDISSPTFPRLQGRADYPLLDADHPEESGFIPADLTAAGDTVYVSGNALCLFDMTRPEQPRFLRFIENQARRLRLSGTLLGALGEFDATFFDISEPRKPKRVARIENLSFCYDMALESGRAWIASGENGLLVYDLLRPQGPVQLAGFKWNEKPPIYPHASSVTVSGGLAWVGTPYGSIQAFDVNKPPSQAEVSRIDQRDYVNDLLTADGRLLAAGLGCFAWYDITKPGSPKPLGKFDRYGHARRLVAAGQTLLVLNGELGFDLLDLAKPAAPKLLSRFQTDGEVWDAEMEGDQAWIAAGSAGFLVVDLSAPRSPRLLGQLTLDLPVEWVRRQNDRIAVVGTENQLVTVDATDAVHPRRLGAIGVGEISALGVRGCHAYVGRGGSPLTIVELADPLSPRIATEVELPTRPSVQDIVFHGDRMVIRNVGASMYLFSLEDPLQPLQRAELHLMTEGNSSLIGPVFAGGKAFMANFNELHPVSLEAKDKLRALAPCRLHGYQLDPSGIVTASGHLYLSSWGRVYIYKIGTPPVR